MKNSTVVWTLLAGFLLAAARADETSAPTLAIFTTGAGRPRPNPGPKILAALWSDGMVVWSASRIEGGPPYQRGRFARAKLDSLLQGLEQKGAFTNAALARGWLGPDASFTTIAINDGPRRLRMRSWHELSGQRTNLVVTAHGVELLGKRDREQVMREQPASYRQFQSTWSEIRQAVAALIPEAGEPYEGKIQLPSR
ncbi:MAG: hypothetical protein HZA90_24540 [Verrucomicrobia bacterium]|nr:hypothetical protein [Verrucomicrobiota bacterium]